MALIDDLKEYYSNLLIIQYNNKPKAKATIELFIDVLLANMLIVDVRDAFFINDAVGVQLDTIGKIVGVDRFFTGYIYETDKFFAFTNYDLDPPSDLQAGMALYSDFETKEGNTLIYPNLLPVGNMLDDEQFRILIKLKVVQNSINHSEKSIDDSLYKLFGDEIEMTTLNKMDISYFVPNEYYPLVKVIGQKGLFPKPMGVRLQYAIKRTNDYFGFVNYDSFATAKKGFDTYADESIGNVLKYNKLIEV